MKPSVHSCSVCFVNRQCVGDVSAAVLLSLVLSTKGCLTFDVFVGI